jgi:hypothetical protein
MERLPLETSQNVLQHVSKDDLFRVAWTSKRLRHFATAMPDWSCCCRFTVKRKESMASSKTDLYVERVEAMQRSGLRLEVDLSVDKSMSEMELSDSPWMAVVNTTIGAISTGSVTVLRAALPAWMMTHWLTQCTTPAPALQGLHLVCHGSHPPLRQAFAAPRLRTLELRASAPWFPGAPIPEVTSFTFDVGGKGSVKANLASVLPKMTELRLDVGSNKTLRTKGVKPLHLVRDMTLMLRQALEVGLIKECLRLAPHVHRLTVVFSSSRTNDYQIDYEEWGPTLNAFFPEEAVLDIESLGPRDLQIRAADAAQSLTIQDRRRSDQDYSLFQYHFARKVLQRLAHRISYLTLNARGLQDLVAHGDSGGGMQLLPQVLTVDMSKSPEFTPAPNKFAHKHPAPRGYRMSCRPPRHHASFLVCCTRVPQR